MEGNLLALNYKGRFQESELKVNGTRREDFLKIIIFFFLNESNSKHSTVFWVSSYRSKQGFAQLVSSFHSSLPLSICPGSPHLLMFVPWSEGFCEGCSWCSPWCGWNSVVVGDVGLGWLIGKMSGSCDVKFLSVLFLRALYRRGRLTGGKLLFCCFENPVWVLLLWRGKFNPHFYPDHSVDSVPFSVECLLEEGSFMALGWTGWAEFQSSLSALCSRLKLDLTYFS